MKKFLLTAVLAFTAAWVFAQERIAVFPFEDMDNVLTRNESTLFYRQFSNEFTNRGRDNFTVVPRHDVERLINIEATFQLTSYSDRAKTTEWQRVLNGTQILSGIIGKFGNGIHISVSLYTYPDLQQLPGGTDMTVTDKNELLRKIPELVQRMLAELVGTTNRTYNIGETGPAGGYVFYDKGVFSDGWRYLEAAPSVSEFYVEWGDTNNYFFVDNGGVTGNWLELSDDIGSGKENTQKIVDVAIRHNITNHAAQMCSLMNTNGFRDWFLPSGGELNMMYENLRQRGLGGFSNAFYCTSSYAGSFFLSRDFGSGEHYPTYVGQIFFVRAIRAF